MPSTKQVKEPESSRDDVLKEAIRAQAEVALAAAALARAQSAVDEATKNLRELIKHVGK